MGILELSPANVKLIRDVLIIGMVGAVVVISLAFAIYNLQQALSLILPA